MTHANAEYARLLSRLGSVRRAWRWTVSMSGLVVAVSEIAGLVAVGVLVDLLFAPERAGRIVLLAVVAGMALFMLVRHVLRPLTRRISHNQIALLLEERSPKFEGSLIAAVEFGPSADLDEKQIQIIDAIVQEAASRIVHFDIRQALNFKRFRKYGALAVVLIAAYFAAGYLMPSTVGKHMARVVTPWAPTPEEREAKQKAQTALLPLSLTLSRGDTSLLRGSSFDLEATLSRKAPAAVTFHFRSYDAANPQGSWKMLPMKEIEKLNGYQLVLPDVNEGLEFYVASGTCHSPTHHLNVYDPLVMQGAQLTTKYPDYLKLPDKTETVPAPDVEALVGSQVTVRLLTNRPLAEGSITWEGGTAAPMTVDPLHKDQATISFPIEATTSYTYSLKDISGQEYKSPGSTMVKAIADAPPAIKLMHPEPMVMAQPLSELAFVSEMSDDFGVVSAQMGFFRGTDSAGAGTRVPVRIDGNNGRAVLMLEAMSPRPQPGETITAYMECTDAKGQRAVTDLVLITVVPFDAWATWAGPEKPHPAHELHELPPLLVATWRLDAQKPQLGPKIFDKQAEELAATMVDDKGKMFEFVDMTKITDAEKKQHAEKAVKLIAEGHGQLARHDTPSTLVTFRTAMTELTLAGLQETVVVHPPSDSEMAAATERMKQIEVKIELPPAASGAANAPPPKAEQEKDAARKVAEIQKEQQKLAEQMKQAQKGEAGAEKPKDKGGEQRQKEAAKGKAPEAQAQAQPANKDPKAAEQKPQPMAQKGKAGAEPKAAAEKQKALAEKTKKAAEDAKAQAGKQAGDKLDAVARTMQEAAKHMEQDEKEKAQQLADDAVKQLNGIVLELQSASQDQLGRMLDHAEELAQRLTTRQKDLRTKSESLTADLAGNKPDAAQERQLKELTHDQAETNIKVDQLAKDVDVLHEVAQSGYVKEETARQIDEAQLQIKRNRVQQRTANAAVELAAGHPDNAADEQKRAETGLRKVLDIIREANDSRATGYEAELKRAKNEVVRISEALAAANTTDPAQRKEAAQQAATDAERLSRHLQLRQFAQGDKQFLQEQAKLQQMTADAAALLSKISAQGKDADFAAAITFLRGKLETEYAAMLEARKLFASQREECPPQYRQLVNKYFEALSTRKP